MHREHVFVFSSGKSPASQNSSPSPRKTSRWGVMATAVAPSASDVTTSSCRSSLDDRIESFRQEHFPDASKVAPVRHDTSSDKIGDSRSITCSGAESAAAGRAEASIDRFTTCMQDRSEGVFNNSTTQGHAAATSVVSGSTVETRARSSQCVHNTDSDTTPTHTRSIDIQPPRSSTTSHHVCTPAAAHSHDTSSLAERDEKSNSVEHAQKTSGNTPQDIAKEKVEERVSDMISKEQTDTSFEKPERPQVAGQVSTVHTGVTTPKRGGLATEFEKALQAKSRQQASEAHARAQHRSTSSEDRRRSREHASPSRRRTHARSPERRYPSDPRRLRDSRGAERNSRDHERRRTSDERARRRHDRNDWPSRDRSAGGARSTSRQDRRPRMSDIDRLMMELQAEEFDMWSFQDATPPARSAPAHHRDDTQQVRSALPPARERRTRRSPTPDRVSVKPVSAVTTATKGASEIGGRDLPAEAIKRTLLPVGA